MSDPFESLLEVQDHDTTIDQLRHRQVTLPARAELAGALARRAEIGARQTAIGADRDRLAARQAEFEGQIDSSRARRDLLEKRMFGGQVAAARDLQAMDEEVRHLTRHVADLEDRELEVMEELEPLDLELAVLETEAEDLEARVARLRAELAGQESAIDAEITTRRAERDGAAAGIGRDLLDRYETLRTRLGGTGAARLVGGSCSGCHLVLPSMEVDRIRKAPPDALITCDQCGRILVR